MYLDFRVGPDRGLVLAESDAVPRLMIVSGPNGAGKSTMLELLHRNQDQAQPGTHVMYINPNRPWRRSQVTAMATLGMGDQSFRSMIEAPNAPQWQFGIPQGMNFLNYSTGVRTRDTIDDVQSLVKVHIINLERRRQIATTALVDAGKRGEELNFDAYAPLRRYVETLLPHLRFKKVDIANANEQRVVFEKLDGLAPIDLELDDLSSGEKAVVGLMFPFIEGQFEGLLKAQTLPVVPPAIPTVLIDEPEIHLHPALQMNLLAYMRELAESDEAQFILCTHSTTIIDSAADGELFVLTPPSTTGGNQLLPVANTAEKLEAVRELTGSAHTVTRCRPIIFVEGETVGGRTPADHRIIELLIPESKSWVLVPAHGRSEAIRAATDLREPTLTGLPGLSVFALVDSDQGYPEAPEWVVEWPVAMQENLLLDAEAIWSMLVPHKGADSRIPNDFQSLEAELGAFASDRRDREIELRVRRHIKRLSINEWVGSLTDYDTLRMKVVNQVDTFITEVGDQVKITDAVAKATEEVDKLLREPSGALEKFHGKELLDRVYARYSQPAGWSGKAAFAYNLAALVAKRDSTRLKALLTVPVRKIQSFVPVELISALVAIESLEGFGDVDVTLRAMQAERACWEHGVQGDVNRPKVRAEILAVARRLQAGGHSPEHDRLLAALAQFSV